MTLLYDPAVYYRYNRRGGGSSVGGASALPLIITLYIDDLVLVGPDLYKIEQVKKELRKRFEMSDIGQVKDLLSMQIEHFADGSIFLHQSRYIRDIIDKFRMTNGMPSDTPMAPKIIPSDTSFDV